MNLEDVNFQAVLEHVVAYWPKDRKTICFSDFVGIVTIWTGETKDWDLAGRISEVLYQFFDIEEYEEWGYTVYRVTIDIERFPKLKPILSTKRYEEMDELNVRHAYLQHRLEDIKNNDTA